MQERPTTTTTLGDLTEELQQESEQLVSLWLNGSSNQTLHPLGISAKPALLRLSHKLEKFKLALGQLQGELKAQPISETELLEYLNLVKEEEETQRLFLSKKQDIKECLELIKLATPLEATPVANKKRDLIEGIESLAGELGEESRLKTYVESTSSSSSATAGPVGSSSPSTNILIASKYTVLELQFSDELFSHFEKETTISCRVERQEDMPPLARSIGSLLASHLRKPDFASFKRDIALLFSVDRLVETFTGPLLKHGIDLFHQIHALKNDLDILYPPTMQNSLFSPWCITEAGYPGGPTLAYWMHPGQFLRVKDWPRLIGQVQQGKLDASGYAVLQRLYRMHFQVESALLDSKLLPEEAAKFSLGLGEQGCWLGPDQESWRGAEGWKSNAELIVIQLPVRMMICLDPPVLMPSKIAQSFMFQDSEMTEAGENVKGREVNFFESLVGQTISTHELITWPEFFGNVTRTVWCVEVEEVEEEAEGRYQEFILNTFGSTGEEEEEEDSIDAIAVQVCQIPWISTRGTIELDRIILILRRQLYFNALFQSCINANSYRLPVVTTTTTTTTGNVTMGGTLNDDVVNDLQELTVVDSLDSNTLNTTTTTDNTGSSVNQTNERIKPINLRVDAEKLEFQVKYITPMSQKVELDIQVDGICGYLVKAKIDGREEKQFGAASQGAATSRGGGGGGGGRKSSFEEVLRLTSNLPFCISRSLNFN